MKSIIYQAFEQLDLSSLEAEIYLSLLNQKNISLVEIAKNLKIDRVKLYQGVRNLLDLELLTKTGQGKYQVQPPSKITSLIRAKERQQHKIWEGMQSILPDLNASYEAHTKNTFFSVFDNSKQFMNLFDSVLDDATDEILFYGNAELWVKIIDLNYQKEWTLLRAKKGIKARVLCFQSPTLNWFLDRNAAQLRQYKLLPDSHPCKGVFYIYQNTVISWNPVLARAIKIEDSVISESLRSMFNNLWDKLA